MTTLVTGAAGFIGYHVARRLMARGDAVVGVDNLNAYYDPQLKRDRIASLQRDAGVFQFIAADFANRETSEALKKAGVRKIVHLGAQAGVRYSIENPMAYAHSNLVGHLQMLELARDLEVEHFVYASSSSVYGDSELPFRVEEKVDRPISLYAATKKADELMSEAYSSLYRLPATGLRFFTVYGPWGRPDMAVWIFTKAILEGLPIKVYGDGLMRRDFTFIEDITEGVIKALDNAPPDDGAAKAGGSRAPHRLFNLGNNKSERLERLIELIEAACNRNAIRNFQPMQPGDVKDTYADISETRRDLGFEPKTPIEIGIPIFVEWYRSYRYRG